MPKQKGLAPEAVSILMLLDCFLYLKASGLVLSFIRVHAVAMSTFHHLVEGHLVFTHPLADQFWKGLLCKYPPIQPIALQWDLNLVL